MEGYTLWMAMDDARDARMKSFGRWLAAQRRVKGISQEAAADLAGLSRTQWTRIELGTSGTRPENIPGIASAVNAPVSETYIQAGFAPPGSTVDVFGHVLRTPDASTEIRELHEDLADEFDSWYFRFEGDEWFEKLSPSDRYKAVRKIMREAKDKHA